MHYGLERLKEQISEIIKVYLIGVSFPKFYYCLLHGVHFQNKFLEYLKTYDQNKDEICIRKCNLSPYNRFPVCAESYFFLKLPSNIMNCTTIKKFKQKLLEIFQFCMN